MLAVPRCVPPGGVPLADVFPYGPRAERVAEPVRVLRLGRQKGVFRPNGRPNEMPVLGGRAGRSYVQLRRALARTAGGERAGWSLRVFLAQMGRQRRTAAGLKLKSDAGGGEAENHTGDGAAPPGSPKRKYKSKWKTKSRKPANNPNSRRGKRKAKQAQVAEAGQSREADLASQPRSAGHKRDGSPGAAQLCSPPKKARAGTPPADHAA